MQVCKDCTWHSLCGVVCFCVIQTDDSSLQQYTIICSALIFGIYQFYQVFCQIARFYSNSSDQCLLMIPAGFPKKSPIFSKSISKGRLGPWPPILRGKSMDDFWKLRHVVFCVRVPAWVGSKNVGHLYFHVLLNIFKTAFWRSAKLKMLGAHNKEESTPPRV